MQDENGGDTDNMEKGAHEIFKVGIKIPPFLPNRPALWFAQLEGQFCLAGITSDTTKFYNATSQLDPQFAIEVADIIESPPKDNKYQTLKAELIRRLSKPREEEIRQFLDNQELGTRKPSQFLRHLQHLAGPQVPDEFIRSAWHNRLPNNIQPIIASHMDMPLEKLAELAGKIIAIAAPTPPNVYAATSSSANQHAENPPDPYLTVLESLARQVNELTKQVASLSMHNSRSSRSPQHFKRERQPVVAANDCLTHTPNDRLFIVEKKTKLKYLIDTGSDVCVFPKSATRDQRHKTKYELYAANNTIIATYGYISLHLDLGLRRDFTWRFVVADVTRPIIGVDFLGQYNLLVDCRRHRLIDGLTSLSVNAPRCANISVETVAGNSDFHDLLRNYPDVTKPTGKPNEASYTYYPWSTIRSSSQTFSPR
ncbi:unnamed protein product [Pieris macdunnoughi]|uniref:DUF7041 domain-containing protein n=1 Tax=Pieris macdunnoughi TaxID=345717 RepID=A0A821W543_9NEOP|nr:unnamed protein product [Pieris macdunnoughi]